MNQPPFFDCNHLLYTYFRNSEKMKFNLFSFSLLKKTDILIVIVGTILNLTLPYVISHFTEGVNNENYLDKMTQKTNIILLLMTMSIFIPMIEEYIFRGILIKLIFKNLKWLGSIVSIVLFTLMHSPTSFIEYLIFGSSSIIYVLAFNKTKRLEVPIIIHMLNNLVATIF